MQHYSENRLLGAVPEAERSSFDVNLVEVPFERGTVLYHPEQPIEHVYFPRSGMVSFLVLTEGGDAIETAIVGREGVVGSEVARGVERSFPHAAIQIPGAGWRMKTADFVHAYDRSQRLRHLVDLHHSLLMIQSQQNAACHALHNVQGRLCRWLLQAQDVVGSTTVDLTQEFLSHMLGVQRTSVSVCAHTLQQAGFIKYSRGQIKILNRDGLEECACECYRVIRDKTDQMLPPERDRSHCRVLAQPVKAERLAGHEPIPFGAAPLSPPIRNGGTMHRQDRAGPRRRPPSR